MWVSIQSMETKDHTHPEHYDVQTTIGDLSRSSSARPNGNANPNPNRRASWRRKASLEGPLTPIEIPSVDLSTVEAAGRSPLSASSARSRNSLPSTHSGSGRSLASMATPSKSLRDGNGNDGRTGLGRRDSQLSASASVNSNDEGRSWPREEEEEEEGRNRVPGLSTDRAGTGFGPYHSDESDTAQTPSFPPSTSPHLEGHVSWIPLPEAVTTTQRATSVSPVNINLNGSLKGKKVPSTQQHHLQQRRRPGSRGSRGSASGSRPSSASTFGSAFFTTSSPTSSRFLPDESAPAEQPLRSPLVPEDHPNDGLGDVDDPNSQAEYSPTLTIKKSPWSDQGRSVSPTRTRFVPETASEGFTNQNGKRMSMERRDRTVSGSSRITHGTNLTNSSVTSLHSAMAATGGVGSSDHPHGSGRIKGRPRFATGGGEEEDTEEEEEVEEEGLAEEPDRVRRKSMASSIAPSFTTARSNDRVPRTASTSSIPSTSARVGSRLRKPAMHELSPSSSDPRRVSGTSSVLSMAQLYGGGISSSEGEGAVDALEARQRAYRRLTRKRSNATVASVSRSLSQSQTLGGESPTGHRQDGSLGSPRAFGDDPALIEGRRSPRREKKFVLTPPTPTAIPPNGKGKGKEVVAQDGQEQVFTQSPKLRQPSSSGQGSRRASSGTTSLAQTQGAQEGHTEGSAALSRKPSSGGGRASGDERPLPPRPVTSLLAPHPSIRPRVTSDDPTKPTSIAEPSSTKGSRTTSHPTPVPVTEASISQAQKDREALKELLSSIDISQAFQLVQQVHQQKVNPPVPVLNTPQVGLLPEIHAKEGPAGTKGLVPPTSPAQTPSSVRLGKQQQTSPPSSPPKPDRGRSVSLRRILSGTGDVREDAAPEEKKGKMLGGATGKGKGLANLAHSFSIGRRKSMDSQPQRKETTSNLAPQRGDRQRLQSMSETRESGESTERNPTEGAGAGGQPELTEFEELVTVARSSLTSSTLTRRQFASNYFELRYKPIFEAIGKNEPPPNLLQVSRWKRKMEELERKRKRKAAQQARMLSGMSSGNFSDYANLASKAKEDPRTRSQSPAFGTPLTVSENVNFEQPTTTTFNTSGGNTSRRHTAESFGSLKSGVRSTQSISATPKLGAVYPSHEPGKYALGPRRNKRPKFFEMYPDDLADFLASGGVLPEEEPDEPTSNGAPSRFAEFTFPTKPTSQSPSNQASPGSLSRTASALGPRKKAKSMSDGAGPPVTAAIHTSPPKSTTASPAPGTAPGTPSQRRVADSVYDPTGRPTGPGGSKRQSPAYADEQMMASAQMDGARSAPSSLRQTFSRSFNRTRVGKMNGPARPGRPHRRGSESATEALSGEVSEVDQQYKVHAKTPPTLSDVESPHAASPPHRLFNRTSKEKYGQETDGNKSTDVEESDGLFNLNRFRRLTSDRRGVSRRGDLARPDVFFPPNCPPGTFVDSEMPQGQSPFPYAIGVCPLGPTNSSEAVPIIDIDDDQHRKMKETLQNMRDKLAWCDKTLPEIPGKLHSYLSALSTHSENTLSVVGISPSYDHPVLSSAIYCQIAQDVPSWTDQIDGIEPGLQSSPKRARSYYSHDSASSDDSLFRDRGIERKSAKSIRSSRAQSRVRNASASVRAISPASRRSNMRKIEKTAMLRDSMEELEETMALVTNRTAKAKHHQEELSQKFNNEAVALDGMAQELETKHVQAFSDACDKFRELLEGSDRFDGGWRFLSYALTGFFYVARVIFAITRGVTRLWTIAWWLLGAACIWPLWLLRSAFVWLLWLIRIPFFLIVWLLGPLVGSYSH